MHKNKFPLSGSFVTDKGGSVSPGLREQDGKSEHGGTAPTDRSDSVGQGLELVGVINTMTPANASHVNEKRERLIKQANREAIPVGVAMDKQIKIILDGAKRGTISEATMKKYYRDVELMRAQNLTPYQKATSAKHWSRLRAAWLAVEVQELIDLRKKSEKARRAGDEMGAKALTYEAWERAVILDQMFLQPDSPRWADKAQDLKAEGIKPTRKSKRFGPKAPTPESLLFSLSKVRGAQARHDVRATTLALFGMRPEELRKGVELRVIKGHLVANIRGAKVGQNRGQERRSCALPIVMNSPVDGAAIKWLATVVEENGGRLKVETTDADIQSLNNALAKISPGLSCYSFRHKVGSNLKASVRDEELKPEEASAFLGHRTTKSLSYYGRATAGRSGKKYRAKIDEVKSPVRSAPASRKQKQQARKNLRHTLKSLEP